MLSKGRNKQAQTLGGVARLSHDELLRIMAALMKTTAANVRRMGESGGQQLLPIAGTAERHTARPSSAFALFRVI